MVGRTRASLSRDPSRQDAARASSMTSPAPRSTLVKRAWIARTAGVIASAVLAGAGVTAVASIQGTSENSGVFEQIDRLIQREMEDSRIPGVALAIVQERGDRSPSWVWPGRSRQPRYATDPLSDRLAHQVIHRACGEAAVRGRQDRSGRSSPAVSALIPGRGCRCVLADHGSPSAESDELFLPCFRNRLGDRRERGQHGRACGRLR